MFARRLFSVVGRWKMATVMDYDWMSLIVKRISHLLRTPLRHPATTTLNPWWKSNIPRAYSYTLQLFFLNPYSLPVHKKYVIRPLNLYPVTHSILFAEFHAPDAIFAIFHLFRAQFLGNCFHCIMCAWVMHVPSISRPIKFWHKGWLQKREFLHLSSQTFEI